MDDTFFSALAEWIVEVTDERFGSRIAWVAAIVVILLPIVILLTAIWWFAR